MGKEYRDLTNTESKSKTSSEMRIHSQRPGTTDENGEIVYFTEQSHKENCDVNKIISKYHKTGLIDHVSKIEATYGDVTGLEFKSAQDKIIGAKQMFDELPSNIRKRFKNKPHRLIHFMDDPNNRDEAIELGIINRDWTEETDGMGEHVKMGENKTKTIINNESENTPA